MTRLMLVKTHYTPPREPLVIVGEFFGLFKIAIRANEVEETAVTSFFAIRESSPNFILESGDNHALIIEGTSRITQFLAKMERYGIRS